MQIFGWTYTFLSPGQISRRGMAGHSYHMVGIIKFLNDCQNHFPKRLYNFTFLPAVYENCCSTPLPTCAVVGLFNFSHWRSMQRYLILVLTWTSLLTNDVKHLFICSFALCISSLVKVLVRSFVHFLIELFALLLLSSENSLFHLKHFIFHLCRFNVGLLKNMYFPFLHLV